MESLISSPFGDWNNPGVAMQPLSWPGGQGRSFWWFCVGVEWLSVPVAVPAVLFTRKPPNKGRCLLLCVFLLTWEIPVHMGGEWSVRRAAPLNSELQAIRLFVLGFGGCSQCLQQFDLKKTEEKKTLSRGLPNFKLVSIAFHAFPCPSCLFIRMNLLRQTLL